MTHDLFRCQCAGCVALRRQIKEVARRTLIGLALLIGVLTLAFS